jgi:hypothetical protein
VSKSVASCLGVFSLAVAPCGDAFAQAQQEAAPTYTLPSWLSRAGEHWVWYYGVSYIDTKSIRSLTDDETGTKVIEYWTVTAGRILTKVFLMEKYLDCKTMKTTIASVAARTIDGLPDNLPGSRTFESDQTYEHRDYESIVPGDPDKAIAQTMCAQPPSASTTIPLAPHPGDAAPGAMLGASADASLSQPGRPMQQTPTPQPAWRSMLRQLGRAMQTASTPPPPAYSPSDPGTGQPVYAPSECVGPIVAGVCQGAILPNQATHPVCHGEMLNGTCTGPMF